jgi:hypothetical protein
LQEHFPEKVQELQNETKKEEERKKREGRRRVMVKQKRFVAECMKRA